MSKNNKVTITIDMDALREHIRQMAKENDGLEDSSGTTPDDLEQAWASTIGVLGPEGDALRSLVFKVITMMQSEHDKFKKDEDEDADDEDEDADDE